MSVHHEYISKLQPTRCATFLDLLFLQMLYMFQAVPPPIIRSKKLYNTAFRYCQPMWLLAASVDEVELPETCTASVEIHKSRNVASC